MKKAPPRTWGAGWRIGLSVVLGGGRRRRAVGEAVAIEEQCGVGVGVVGDEDQEAEVVGQNVGELEPRAVVVQPLEPGLLGLVPADGEANRRIDDLGRVAGLDDDDLEDLAKGPTAVGVHLPDPEGDQGAQGGI